MKLLFLVNRYENASCGEIADVGRIKSIQKKSTQGTEFGVGLLPSSHLIPSALNLSALIPSALNLSAISSQSIIISIS